MSSPAAGQWGSDPMFRGLKSKGKEVLQETLGTGQRKSSHSGRVFLLPIPKERALRYSSSLAFK